MKQFSNCLGAVLATLFCACTDGRTLEPRTGEPKLTREHALARAARISEVAYGLEFELDGEAPEYAGRVEISFDLSDVHEDLTVDFVGGTVSHVNINGRVMVASPVGKDGDNAEFSDRLAVPYNGFFLNLPAQALQTGTNVVEIAFSHPYSSDSSGMYRFTDPVDGRVYLYTDFEPYDQNRLFPSFDQDRRWNVLKRLNGFGYTGVERLLNSEQQRDQSDKGRRQALGVAAARPDPEQQRRLMQELLDPDSGLSVADARASAGGLFPIHQHALQLQIVSEVFDKLQFISDNIEPGYFRSITGGLLGVICDTGYLAQLDQSIEYSETLHPLLRKQLLDMRFEVKRCLAIGAAYGDPSLQRAARH